jgi:hypothetical protein
MSKAEKKAYIYPYGSYSNMDVSNNGEYIIASCGEYLFLINFKNETLIVENKEENNIKIIYPNPSTNIVTIEFSQASSGNTNIELINIEGKLIKTVFNSFLEAGIQTIKINTNDIPSGKYYIIVQNEDEKIVFQLIVNH